MADKSIDSIDLDFRRSPAVLSRIVDVTATGLFTVDRSGRFVAWNRAAEQITGYTSQEVIGQPCTLLEGPNCTGFGKLSELLGDSTPDAGVCEQRCKVLAKNGREVYLHGNLCVLRDDTGAVIGAVGTFVDITSVIRANEKIERLAAQTGVPEALQKMVGESSVMHEVFRRLRLAADSDVTVLLTGESGTGKELAAHAIHDLSARRKKPFLAVNCSAIPETLLESELFGHVAGSFTGAVRDKDGLFVAAEGGTLFLDEIGDVSPAIQVKLLRVLQEREVRRVGDERPTKINVRLITATNRDLKQLVKEEKIREDFYYRIRVFEIGLPPLRDRVADLPRLTQFFINELSREYGKPVNGITREAMEAITRYPWPGNVRELRNAIEHAMVTVSGDRVDLLDLPPDVRSANAGDARPRSLTTEELAERDRIIKYLERAGGNRTKAAEMLGTSRVTLWKKMTKYGIEVPPKSK